MYSRQMEHLIYPLWQIHSRQYAHPQLLTPHCTDYTHKQHNMRKSNILVQEATAITHY